MNNKIVVTVSDYDRLTELAGTADQNLRTGFGRRLSEKLSGARQLPAESIDKRVVTMNSTVHLKDLNSHRETDVTITFPHDADPREKRISVLSEIGIALLGAKEDDIVSWKTPVGHGRFVITKVTYQPEAAGHFHL